MRRAEEASPRFSGARDEFADSIVCYGKAALGVFRSHLGILSPRQSKPLSDNYDEYLTPVEVFLVEGPAER